MSGELLILDCYYLSGEFDYGKGVLMPCVPPLQSCLGKSYDKCWIRFLRDYIDQVGACLGFGDDIDIIGRSLRAVTETFLTLEGPAKNLGS